MNQACREAGISRSLFYRWRKRYLAYGADGLHPRQTEARRGRARIFEIPTAPEGDSPDTWTIAPLGICVDVLDSQRKPVNASERAPRLGKIAYYGATGQVGWIDDHLFDEELVLLGEDGAPFLDKTKSIAYIISGKSWVNNHAHVLRARRELTSNRYIKYFLDWFDFTGYVQGSTRDKLTQGAMNSIPVRLPPPPGAEISSKRSRTSWRLESPF